MAFRSKSGMKIWEEGETKIAEDSNRTNDMVRIAFDELKPEVSLAVKFVKQQEDEGKTITPKQLQNKFVDTALPWFSTLRDLEDIIELKGRGRPRLEEATAKIVGRRIGREPDSVIRQRKRSRASSPDSEFYSNK